MFKTNSIKKGTLPEPLGELKLKGEEDFREFFKVHIGKVVTKVSDKEYQFVDGAYYQIAKDKYVASTECSIVMYYANSYN
jgi:hypothetical protein